MLFLMNDAVLTVDRGSPRGKLGGRKLSALTLDFVSRLGRELYAAEPLLHLAAPARARRLCALIAARGPRVNAALFVAPARACAPDAVSVRLAHVDTGVMAHLLARQKAGDLSCLTADREVWRRLAA